jgi:integrase
MASIRDQRARGRGYEVRWRDPDGKERTRSLPTLRAAKDLQREVEDSVALGRRWEPRDARPAPHIPEILEAYIRDRARTKGQGTVRLDGFTLDVYVRFLRQREGARSELPASLLSRALHVDFYEWLKRTPGKGQGRPPGEAARQKYIRRVEHVWAWAFDSEEYGDFVPRPRRIDLPTLTSEPTIAPSWEEADACVLAASGWLQRVLVVERYTGLRVQQVMGLRWSDFDLDRAILRVRGALGKTRDEKKGRVIPISEHLVDELAGWGRREGLLIESGRKGVQARIVRQRDVCRAWARAGVRPEVWQKRPNHALRKAFISGLKRLRADIDAIEFLVGHKRPGQRSVYTDPESIPMREAVALVPKIGRADVLREPIRLDSLRSSRR